MSLFQLALGEVTDRMHILDLKLLHGQHNGSASVSPGTQKAWQQERALCDNFVMIKTKARNIREKFDYLSESLKQINRELWRLEDEIRAMLRLHNYYHAGKIAAEITAKNERRAELVGQLNRLEGRPADVKVYTMSDGQTAGLN